MQLNISQNVLSHQDTHVFPYVSDCEYTPDVMG